MDVRAVFILLCMVFAQAPCRPVGSEEVRRLLLKEIQDALQPLDIPEFLPNISCSTLNITELVGLKQQPLSAHHLPTIRCYLQKLSELIPEVSDKLRTSAQFIQDIERRSSSSLTHHKCSLPALEQVLDGYVFARCFLKLVENGLAS